MKGIVEGETKQEVGGGVLRCGDDVSVGAAEEDGAGDAVGWHRQQDAGVAAVFNADFHGLSMDGIAFAQRSRPEVDVVFT